MKAGAVLWRPVWQSVAIRPSQRKRTAQALLGVAKLRAKLAAAGFDAQTYQMQREGTDVLMYGVRINGRRGDMQRAQVLCPSRGRVVPGWMRPRQLHMRQVGPGEVHIDFL